MPKFLILTCYWLSHDFFFLSQRNKTNKPIAVAAATPPTISIVLLVPGEVGLGVVTVMLGVGVGEARIGLGDAVCVGVGGTRIGLGDLVCVGVVGGVEVGIRTGLGDIVCVGGEVGVGVALGKTNVSGIAYLRLVAPLGSSKVKLRLSTPL